MTEPGSPRAVRAARLEAEVKRLDALVRKLVTGEVILALIVLWLLFR